MNAVEKMIGLAKEVRSTQLGVGPMSEATVLATIDLATSLRFPIMLIASRRQVECEEQGGGYVHGWNTKSFAEYVRQRDPSGFVLLCRDHGGPWQNTGEVEKKLGEKEAMESAQHSFEQDIRAGFNILHIDPSVGLESAPAQKEVLERLKKLFLFCHEKSRELQREVYFEFGKEEQGVEVGEGEDLSTFLEEILRFAKENNLPKPLFVVGQTGTKVVERRNIGSFESHFRHPGEVPAAIQIPKLVDVCNRYGVFLKAHNVDYLSDEGIRWHTRLGVHAANIAPEFGVGETLQILSICREFGFKQEEEEFLSLSYESRKWEKWLLPNTTTTDREKAIISGHYVFSTPSFRNLKERLKKMSHAKGLDFEKCLVEKIKQLIYRYLFNFNLVRR